MTKIIIELDMEGKDHSDAEVYTYLTDLMRDDELGWSYLSPILARRVQRNADRKPINRKPVKKLFLTKIEAVPILAKEKFVCRPHDGLGTMGSSPFLWTAVCADSPEGAERRFRERYAKQITNYESTEE